MPRRIRYNDVLNRVRRVLDGPNAALIERLAIDMGNGDPASRFVLSDALIEGGHLFLGQLISGRYTERLSRRARDALGAWPRNASGHRAYGDRQNADVEIWIEDAIATLACSSMCRSIKAPTNPASPLPPPPPEDGPPPRR